MTVPFTERFFPPIEEPAPWPQLGQSVSVAGTGGTAGFTLISYLTDPVPNNSRLDYVLIGHEDADAFQWTFSDGDGLFSYDSTQTDNVAHFTVPSAGRLRAQVTASKAGKVIATLQLTQNVVEPSIKFQTLVADLIQGGSTPPDAQVFSLHEICEELKPYIDAAAASTGALGIPSRLLAAVLFMEVWGRPKDGSPKARQIRKGLEGKEFNPRTQAIEDNVRGWLGMKVTKTHLDSIRDVELEMIRGFLNEFADDDLWDPLVAFDPRLDTSWYASRKSLGVGQIAQTTAAMTSGLIAWREMTEGKKQVTLDAIDADFHTLTLTALRGIFRGLRFPNSNILTAAQLLTKLKNRPHRFPDMSPLDVLNSKQAIGIIATEYNRGAFDTPLATMTNNNNGDRAVHYVFDDTVFLKRYFPDPPP